jgi:hypothetical protein
VRDVASLSDADFVFSRLRTALYGVVLRMSYSSSPGKDHDGLSLCEAHGEIGEVGQRMGTR